MSSTYDLHPIIHTFHANEPVLKGYSAIIDIIASYEGRIVLLDLYPGVDKEEILSSLRDLSVGLIIDVDTLKKESQELEAALWPCITDDRVFGYRCDKPLSFCFDEQKVAEAKRANAHTDHLRVLLVGVGASLLAEEALLLYFDLTRFEIQERFERGMPNWLFCNGGAPALEKFKRGYFIEWRMADAHKREIWERIDWVVDTHTPGEPKTVRAQAVRRALSDLSSQPFRMEPYFTPGVWGGQWMRSHFALPAEKPNYAWCFDGVPEENSLNLGFGDVVIKIPAINAVLLHPETLLGDRVYERYGAEFPIRFDLLDTMGGGNLSLQVHPLPEYIRSTFGMAYTQHESYYILDAGEDSAVYLGLKEGVDRDRMAEELYAAQERGTPFDSHRYINALPAKKHDHFSIPAGTIHCSGKNTVVLEISSTPYIFTFKLYDWGRVGLDGEKRPIHLDHALANVQWERDVQWVTRELVDRIEVVDEADGYQIEYTGLHESEPIATERYTVSGVCEVTMDGSVQVVNLVEGRRACIESPTGAFAPFELHYAETAIIPAAVNTYVIVAQDGETVKLIAARIR